MRLRHKDGGGFRGSKVTPNLSVWDAGGAPVCPSSHGKYSCSFGVFLGGVGGAAEIQVLTKSSSHATGKRDKVAIHIQS